MSTTIVLIDGMGGGTGIFYVKHRTQVFDAGSLVTVAGE
jgi:hypothetical protein